MATSAELFVKAADLRRQADEVSKEAIQVRRNELAALPLADRMVYAATNRCPCGAGLAYDPVRPGVEKSVSNFWDCSAIMLGTADPKVEHTGKLPFAFYEIKSEGQPSANGATTR